MTLRILSTLLLTITLLSCSDRSRAVEQIQKLQSEKDSLQRLITENETLMKKQMTTSFTFQDGNAENAMNMYVELFDNSRIISVQRWPAGGPVEEGKIMQGRFELNGNLFMCSDSPAIHDWDFSPAVATYIECDDEAEMERLFAKLSENGDVPMPLNNYGFSQKFGWVIDQYGVSWQLNLQ